MPGKGALPPSRTATPPEYLDKEEGAVNEGGSGDVDARRHLEGAVFSGR